MLARVGVMNLYVNAWLGNGLSAGAIVATIAGWLPPFAAVVALIWYAIQIWESKTIQNYLYGRRQRQMARLKIKMAKLEALELIDKNKK
jgi:hypothetical protein